MPIAYSTYAFEEEKGKKIQNTNKPFATITQKVTQTQLEIDIGMAVNMQYNITNE